ncbi:hypothetical protein ABBQ32_000575 [Trebouxia sp. C0010 RCD-2024]
MAYLDPATVTDILRRRPVYIATETIMDYDSPKFRILAVHFSLDAAILKALQVAFSGLWEDSYNPHKRWRRDAGRVQDESNPVDYDWHDDWVELIGMHHYHVEEWQPDNGLVSKSFFSFDSWFKRKISAERPSCTLVNTWRKAWTKSLMSGQIPAELRQRVVPEEQVKKTKYQLAGDREEWVSMYGSFGFGAPWDADSIPAQPAYA